MIIENAAGVILGESEQEPVWNKNPYGGESVSLRVRSFQGTVSEYPVETLSRDIRERTFIGLRATVYDSTSPNPNDWCEIPFTVVDIPKIVGAWFFVPVIFDDAFPAEIRWIHLPEITPMRHGPDSDHPEGTVIYRSWKP